METEIDEKLNEIAEYFKQKLLSGDFEFVSCDEYAAKIIIDKKYDMHVWIANSHENNCDFYFYSSLKTWIEPPFIFKTKKERLAAWKHIKPHVQKYTSNEIERVKREKIDKLQEQLIALNS